MDIEELKNITHPIPVGCTEMIIPSPKNEDAKRWFYVGSLKYFRLATHSDVNLKILLQWSYDGKDNGVIHSMIRSTNIWKSDKIDVILPYVRFKVTYERIVQGTLNKAFSLISFVTHKSNDKAPILQKEVLLPVPNVVEKEDTIIEDNINTLTSESIDMEAGITPLALDKLESTDDVLSIEEDLTKETPVKTKTIMGSVKSLRKNSIGMITSFSRASGNRCSSPAPSEGSEAAKITKKEAILRKWRGIKTPAAQQPAQDAKNVQVARDDRLPPIYAKGCLLYSDGFGWKHLPRGLPNEVLCMGDDFPEWRMVYPPVQLSSQSIALLEKQKEREDRKNEEEEEQ